jgi:hypothetical protein
VSCDAHGYSLRDSRTNQIAGCTPPQIVKQTALAFRFLASGSPRLVEISNLNSRCSQLHGAFRLSCFAARARLGRRTRTTRIYCWAFCRSLATSFCVMLARTFLGHPIPIRLLSTFL